MATYNLHAGHAAVGCGAVGAVSVLNESVEDRKVKDIVIKYLRQAGNTVYDCTEDNGTASQVLNSIVRKCNSHNVDLDISIHFNAGANRPYCDGVTTGTEVYIYNTQSTNALNAANRIAAKIAGIGFKNRGVKCRRDLYYLNNTRAQALLIEVCFVDDGDDANLYNANIDRIGKSIAEGIMNVNIPDPVPIPKPKTVDGGVYRLYNPNAGQHFYTISVSERNNLIDAGWGYEGVGWIAPKSGDVVCRMYNPNTGEHFYTLSGSEIDNLVRAGWKREGMAFRSDKNKKIPVYRLYSGNEHFYTPSEIERNNLKSLGWKDEGIAFYGI